METERNSTLSRIYPQTGRKRAGLGYNPKVTETVYPGAPIRPDLGRKVRYGENQGVKVRVEVLVGGYTFYLTSHC